MGKLITYLSIIIFIDLLFLTTGQLCAAGDCTLTSTIFNAILNVGETTFNQWFLELIGDVFSKLLSITGIWAIGVTGAVVISTFIATREFRILLVPLTFTLAVIAADFGIIAQRLIEFNPVLGVFIMAPLMVIYVMIVVEWLIGKD